jgi:hypothetical protein
MNTAFQIAILRAKMIARHSAQRAVALLVAVGITLNDAARFVFSVLRAQRVAAL